MKTKSPGHLTGNLDEINNCQSCNGSSYNNHQHSCKACESKCTECDIGNNNHVCKTIPKSMQHSKLTKRYSLLLGLFRGATPCLKVFIIAPLLIAVDLWLAFWMVIIFAASSTVYTIIGFISASVLTSFWKYESYVQVAGASILIGIGIFTIITKLLTPICAVG